MMIGRRLIYRLKRRNEYHIHSPFVYELYTKVIREHQRSNVDYDLVVRVGRTVDKKRHILKSRRKLARFFYRYAAYYEQDEVTLFGKVTAMNAAAFALGNPHSRVKVACSGEFVDTLNNLGMVNVERVVIEDELRYCLEHRSDDTVFVFEGIHDNKSAEELWNVFCTHPEVTLTIDFYHAGMVFFREGMEKQGFVLKV
ncbi:MAG: hypothetical protein IKM95_05640 [Bacteroidales bacterium]|nr:hypothetical protein [Bacteroidales bacterium]